MRKIIPEDAILIPDKAERVFGGMIYDVYQWEQANFDDSVATFEMLKRSDTVIVMAIKGNSLLVLEDDQPHRGMILTFPGGRVDPEDSDPLAAAKRELREETGFEFANWRLVQVVQPQLKLEWFVYAFVAWEFTHQGDQAHEPGEKIKVLQKSFAETRELISQGKLRGGHQRLFETTDNLEDMRNLPEFQGKMIER